MEENNGFTEALVLEWLNALPEDIHALASYLRRMGIKGAPGNPTQCPIAKYLMRKAEEAGLATEHLPFAVDAEIIRVYPPEGPVMMMIRTPVHVLNFVVLFDGFEYLNLRHETEQAK